MTVPHVELDILAIFSHPDDAELSVSGTLLKLKSLGYRTGVAVMTRGEMGTRGTPELRAMEALEAARVLNLAARINLELPDGDVSPDEELGEAAVRIIGSYRPLLLMLIPWDLA